MNRHINLEYLNTFVTAAETGKLNLTAELIFRTPSAVSTQIKKLEEQLGTELFVRGKNALLMTGDGETLYRYAKHILKLDEEIFRAVREESRSEKLVFGVPTDYAGVFLTDIYPGLTESFPGCRFHTVCSRSRAIRRLVDAGKVTAAVVAMEPQYRDDLLIWEEPLYWACARGYEVPEKGPLPVAVFSDDCVVNTYTLYSLKHFSGEYEIVFSSTMSDNVRDAVERGVAVSLLPASDMTENMGILPETFLSSPLTLKVGFVHAAGMDEAFSREVYELVRKGFVRAGYGTARK